MGCIWRRASLVGHFPGRVGLPLCSTARAGQEELRKGRLLAVYCPEDLAFEGFPWVWLSVKRSDPVLGESASRRAGGHSPCITLAHFATEQRGRPARTTNPVLYGDRWRAPTGRLHGQAVCQEEAHAPWGQTFQTFKRKAMQSEVLEQNLSIFAHWLSAKQINHVCTWPTGAQLGPLKCSMGLKH